LGRLTERKRPGFAAEVERDYESAPLTARERAMCDYAVKLTRVPWEMREDDLAPMRAMGLSDGDILAVNLITSYFAYANRLADGLGIALEGGDDKLGW
jgi:uncharacterized peroxidase-related enzyme